MFKESLETNMQVIELAKNAKYQRVQSWNGLMNHGIQILLLPMKLCLVLLNIQELVTH